MPEILLHYIWQKMLFASMPQVTTNGQPVTVLSVGRHNLQSGPDFTEVRLKIGECEWVGEIEIHVNASDWYRHRHHLDPAYDRVILHVVRHSDREVYNSQGELVPQLELQYPMDRDYLTGLVKSAMAMDSPFASHSCAKRLLKDPSLLTEGWRHALLIQRLECKRTQILKILEIMHGSWEEAMYITMCRNFGFHTNSLPMEQLAIQTPLPYLSKHHNSLFQLTAMLLGQSGLLTPDFHPNSEEPRALSEEEQSLWNEYCFLQKKFSLVPLEGRIWKRGRIRPQNSPETRIRQFANLIYQSDHLFSKLMEAPNLDAMREILRPVGLGEKSLDIVLINTVIPYRYAYASARGDKSAAGRALEEMNAIAPEDNSIIRQWRELGQSVHTAADTQALIHLYQNYCQPNQCLNCDVGYQIFLKSPNLNK